MNPLIWGYSRTYRSCVPCGFDIQVMGLQRYRHVSSVSFADEGVEREYHPYLSKLNPTCDFKEDFQGSTTLRKKGS